MGTYSIRCPMCGARWPVGGGPGDRPLALAMGELKAHLRYGHGGGGRPRKFGDPKGR